MQTAPILKTMREGGMVTASIRVLLRVEARMHGERMLVRMFLGNGPGTEQAVERVVADLEAFCHGLGYSMRDVEWQSVPGDAPSPHASPLPNSSEHTPSTFSAFDYLY